MSIIRDLGITLPSLDPQALVTCSTAQIPAANAIANGLLSTGRSTGNVIVSTGAGTTGVSGRIIDRLTALFTKDIPLVAVPVTTLYSSVGSTEANRKLTLGVKLQHGDSSGGGDMADYSTGSTPSDKVYFTSARTSDMKAWSTGEADGSGSTGPVFLFSNPAYYDLRAAKRYIRAVHFAQKAHLTTDTSGDEGAHVGGFITFLGNATPRPDTKGFASTTTST